VEEEFKTGKYPKTLKDLAITGENLIEMGFEEGKNIGKILNDIANQILLDKLENDFDQIKNYVKEQVY
jgi:tRNA nucleotidyltransferase (CCA-adding enzyme)